MNISSRKPAIVANWKMYKTIGESVAFINSLAPQMHTTAEVAIAVPFTALKASAEAAASTAIMIGAQNMHEGTEGAFTGEISGMQLVDAGAKFVILGHSERRHYFQETNEQIHKKLMAAFHFKLVPILCIGETEEQRNQGKSKEVVEFQLRKCLDRCPADQAAGMMVAYEPVWAIGTGKTATPEIAQEIHQIIRTALKVDLGDGAATKIRILYGGSVKPENAKQMLEQKDIDGLLIGGASLKVDTFSKL